MFHKLSTTITEADAKLETFAPRDKISEHLTVQLERFEMYFPSEEDPRKHNGLIRNHFLTPEHQLSVSLVDQLLEFAADGSIKNLYESAESLACFWIKALSML